MKTKLCTIFLREDSGIKIRIVNDRYKLLNEIAEGSMSTVFLGQDLELKRPVVIKFLHRTLSDDREWFERFKREATVLSKLRHEHLVTVYSFGKDETGNLFIVTELIEGSNLNVVLKNGSRLNWQRAVSIAIQVCQVMDFVHANGVVHRDLKPGNIMLESGSEDFVKVIDFGLATALRVQGEESAQLTLTGQLIGTPGYMPPELWQAHPFDQRGDIYSLACIFYEMVTGRKVFYADSPMGLMYKHAREKPPRLSDLWQS